MSDTREIRRQVSQMVGDEMDGFALALDAALRGYNADGENDATLTFITGRPGVPIGDADLPLIASL